MTPHVVPSSTFTPRCALVTGGAGFIGSNFIRWMLESNPLVSVRCLDLLTYAGNLDNLRDVDERFGASGDGRFEFVHGDIRDDHLVRQLLRGGPDDDRDWEGPVDAVVHFAAESHVDRSIASPTAFVDTNVNGTLVLLEACRSEIAAADRPFRFVQVGTDEVYGSLQAHDPAFTEATPIAPNSPYAASKASADLLVRAYHETFGLPVIITRCSNNYGPYQFPEKLIPLMITRSLRDESLPVYGDGRNIRDWLHVEDHARALWIVLTRGVLGSVYNIGGEAEAANIDMVREVLRLTGKSESLITFVTDRPGHDRRYAMNISKIHSELGWAPTRQLNDGLRETVDWYLSHRMWWERVLTSAYRTATTMYLAAK